MAAQVDMEPAGHTLNLLPEQRIQVEAVVVAAMMAVAHLVDQVWLSYTMGLLEQHLLLVPHLTP